MQSFLPCLYAFLACVAFCVVFEVRQIRFIITASSIGAVSWFVFLVVGSVGSSVWQYFGATIVVAILAEVFARIYKAPATTFLVIGIIPLVPGGSLYYTMDYLINGDMTMFAMQGLQTGAYAGAIAVGCSLVSSVVKIITFHKRECVKKSRV